MTRLIITTTLIFFCFSCSKAEDTIKFEEFWVRAQPPLSKTTAIYGKITNNSEYDITLHSVKCNNFAEKTELHLSDKNGTMVKMIKLNKLNILKNHQANLKPRGLHIMLIDLKSQINQGTFVSCDFVFEHTIKSLKIPVKKSF